MADNSSSFLYQNSEKEIAHHLSDSRFNPYLLEAGFNLEYAFEIYLYNARLSKSLLFPLHILEVILRNQFSLFFTNEYGADWPRNHLFTKILTKESNDSLDRSIDRKRKTSRKKELNTNDIVSGLSLDFWSNLFRSDYERTIWQKNTLKIFPKALSNETRKTLQKDIKDINSLRNRIAHHEPIHKLDITQKYSSILKFIALINTSVHSWVKHYATINITLSTRPKAISHLFKDMSDSSFKIVLPQDNLLKIENKFNFYVVKKDNHSFCVISLKHISKYLLKHVDSSDQSLMIELNNHSFTNIIDHCNLEENAEIIESYKRISIANSLFTKKVTHIIVLENTKIIGIIEKSHRRY